MLKIPVEIIERFQPVYGQPGFFITLFAYQDSLQILMRYPAARFHQIGDAPSQRHLPKVNDLV